MGHKASKQLGWGYKSVLSDFKANQFSNINKITDKTNLELDTLESDILKSLPRATHNKMLDKNKQIKNVNWVATAIAKK